MPLRPHLKPVTTVLYNRIRQRLSRLLTLHALLAALALPGIASGADAPAAPAPIRFLLTFDDGPSGASWRNPTERILDVLEHNAAQPGIKAIFFAQTGALGDAADGVGRRLLRREHDDGHLLAFHTATPRHSNHRYLGADELAASLRRGGAELQAVAGVAPTLVRPPFWSYDAATLAQYQRHGMRMLLTDLSANDGVIWGVNWSWHKRSNLLANLAELRPRWLAGELPVVDGATPVVVTFHDINRYTAITIEEYLDILLDVARELDMPTAAKPFYDERDALEKAALARTVADADLKPRLPGWWNWIWR
jgi:peptidoglycan-N-acetylglucosamine deacetylase